MSSVRILIADDHEVVRRGIRSFLSLRPSWDVCGEAVDGRDAIEKAKQLQPDVILLDISMPFLNGLEAARIIRREVPQSRILIVSQYDATHMRAKALDAGASGYVAKADLSRELLAAVEGTLDKETLPAPSPAAPGEEEARDIINARMNERERGDAEIRSRLAAIVEDSDDAIVSKDLRGVVLTWNRGAQRLFGYTAQEIIGRPITLIIPPELRQEEARILQSIASGTRIDHFETVRVAKSGERIPVSLSISPLKDAAGNIVGASKIARDITAQRQAERDLRSVQEELEARVKERTSELERAEESLRVLSSRLLQMQDEERRRIARELHDTAGQVVAALNMSLAPLEEKLRKIDPALAEPVTGSIELVNDLSADLRTISYLLHPPLLDESGLASALQWFVEGFTQRSGIRVDVEIAPGFERLPREIEIAIFRIVQECLTNIHRHSGSADATIRLAREEEDLSLEVRDHGQGMPSGLGPAEPFRPGVGIQGMKERARQLGGHLEVQSLPGQGTVVTAVMPLHPPAVN